MKRRFELNYCPDNEVIISVGGSEAIDGAVRAIADAEVLIVGGTSLTVYPAAGLYRYAGNDTPVFIIDPKDVPVHDRRITHIKDVATSGMMTFRELCGKQQGIF